MKKTARILTVVFVVVSLFGSTLTAQAATVKSNKKAKYYKTAGTKKKAGTFKKASKLNAVSMAKGFVKFKKGSKTLYIKATDVKISGKYTAKVSKKTKAYNNKLKATKTVLKKNTSLTISGMKVKKKVAYLKYAAGKFVKATDVKVTSFVAPTPTGTPTETPTVAPTVAPTDAATTVPTTVPTATVEPTQSIEPIPGADSKWDDDGVLKILAIGNSFSEDTMQYVYYIAQSIGVEKIELGHLFYPGCSLSQHWTFAKNENPAYQFRTNTSGSWISKTNVSFSYGVKANNWDYISLQQVSGLSGLPGSTSDLQDVIDYIQTIANPEAKFVWNMTWAYQQDSTHNDFGRYKNDQMTMYNAIVNAVSTKIETVNDIFFVIPTGTAIQNARTSYLGDTLTRDGYHLSDPLGRYIVGLTFVHKLTGLSIDNIEYAPYGVSEAHRDIAVESAKNAVTTPMSVTQSTYLQAP